MTTFLDARVIAGHVHMLNKWRRTRSVETTNGLLEKTLEDMVQYVAPYFTIHVDIHGNYVLVTTTSLLDWADRLRLENAARDREVKER